MTTRGEKLIRLTKHLQPLTLFFSVVGLRPKPGGGGAVQDETFEWLQLAALGPDLLRFPGRNNPSGTFKCPDCEKFFETINGLRMHASRWCPNQTSSSTG